MDSRSPEGVIVRYPKGGRGVLCPDRVLRTRTRRPSAFAKGPGCGARLACEADVEHKTKATADRLSSNVGWGAAVGLCRDLSDVAKGGDGAKSEAAKVRHASPSS
jgi:hypothetical protein